MHQFKTRRRVEFVDTDLSGLVHFSKYFVFMETAEHEMLRSLGVSIHTRHEGFEIGWPRRAVSCEYVSPLRFGDELEITIQVERKGRTTMTYGFCLEVEGREVARGRITAICCVLDDPTGLRAIPVPPFIADQLQAVPVEVSDE